MTAARVADYREVNRSAWTRFAGAGVTGTRPTAAAFDNPRTWLDERGWLPWEEIGSVLCLAAGGGLQAPLFAALGRRVTVADLAPAQLETDRRVAAQRGLEIETVEADMLDLSALHGRDFDLVHQPISSLYVPDVRRLYREVRQVLRPGGVYHVEHWSPVQMQVGGDPPWDGEAYRLVHPQGGGPIAWTHACATGPAVSWNYIHPLDALVGGLCDAGFAIVRFGERGHGHADAPPGSQEHLAAFVPSFLSLLARAPDGRPGPP